MNLYAYKMTNHSVAVMTSFDTVFLGKLIILARQENRSSKDLSRIYNHVNAYFRLLGLCFM